MGETSTEYGQPYRPLPVSIANRLGRLAGSCGIGGRLNVDRLLAAARRKTRLSDFGDEWFVEPLQVLVRAINEEARLTPVGYAFQKTRIISALSIRLRAERLLKKHPEILDIHLGGIVLIAGLQRTATTMLHRLIAAHPNMRAVRAWEALNPVPLPGETRAGPRRRLRFARLAQETIAFLSPDFFAVHPIEHDAPEEDVLLLDLSFMSQTPEATMHVPSYADWLERQDHTRSYEYLRIMLKLLHWQRAAGNWVLKTPVHMEHLDVLLEVFPNAVVVQTHRDPKKSTASFLSMVAHSRGILSDHVDVSEIAGHWTRKIRRMMERSIRVRNAGHAGRFVDVSYCNLVAEPMRELRRIYRHAGIEFSGDAVKAAEAVSQRNTKNRYGRHVYSLGSFGLSAEEIDRRYDFYRREYRIPDEPAT